MSVHRMQRKLGWIRYQQAKRVEIAKRRLAIVALLNAGGIAADEAIHGLGALALRDALAEAVGVSQRTVYEDVRAIIKSIGTAPCTTCRIPVRAVPIEPRMNPARERTRRLKEAAARPYTPDYADRE